MEASKHDERRSDAAPIITGSRGAIGFAVNSRPVRALPVSVSVAAVVAMTVGLPPRRASAEVQVGDPVARQRVAVVKLTFEGGVSEAARDQFAQRLFEGLTAAQFRVMSGPTVRQRLAAAGVDLGGCHA